MMMLVVVVVGMMMRTVRSILLMFHSGYHWFRSGRRGADRRIA
jgi:ABC-type transport system involved in cytochrome bd biosynthesis fused ATPase/permease subunit